MAFTFSPSQPAALAVPLVLALAGCGSSLAGGAATRTPVRATAPPTAAAIATLAAALTEPDMANSGSFSQRSDGPLGGLSGTDARVFTNADSTITVEIDLVTDIGAAGAASDYPPYRSAAAKLVPTRSSTSTPGLGQQSNEYVGTNTDGKKVVAISFIESRYIAVVTTVADRAVTSDVVKTSAESVAQAQDNKINSMGS